MHFFACSLLLAGSALARDAHHARRGNGYQFPQPIINRRNPVPAAAGNAPPQHTPSHQPRPIVRQNTNTTKFKVDGTKIPDVDFDIGESYAGLLPISQQANVSELYFWFFPSANAEATDEILIWLNGGPGCSSLEGLLQENGPFLWQYGTYKPVKNPWTWTNLTNVVWVEQPAGTGFSQQHGTPPATDEFEVAEQFLGFWKNFIDTFNLHNRKVYIAGESYAGLYIPYIADAMYNKTDTTYYGVESILLFGGIITDEIVLGDIPAVPFVDAWSGLFNFNKTFTDHLHQKHEECGYANFTELALTFPPTGPLPSPPDVDETDGSCWLAYEIAQAATLVNPCWDIYQVATTCPILWDVLGFPGTFDYLPEGATIYFNRTEVQKAINAPVGPWEECIDTGILDDDPSPPTSLSVLPRVIEKNTKTVLVHADLDFRLIKNGTLMAIQNMTWSGAQGFSKCPDEWNEFYVPYHSELAQSSAAGSGILGQWHTERTLTFSSVALSGHMVPQYAPSAAYRLLEFLLGRIDNLSEVSDFTTQRGNFGNDNATMKVF